MHKFVGVFIWATLFLAVTQNPCYAERVKAGTERSDVIRLWGEPSARANNGDMEMLVYSDGREVHLRDGVAVTVYGDAPGLASASSEPDSESGGVFNLFNRGNSEQPEQPDEQNAPPPPPPQPTASAAQPTMPDTSEMPAWAQAAFKVGMEQAERDAEAQRQWEAGEYPMWKIILPAAISVLLSILMFMSFWVILRKAGEPGWVMFIPIYNAIVFFRIAGKPGWWILLMFLPFINFIIVIVAYIGLAQQFGKHWLYGLGLLFLPYIFFPMLAFGDSNYGAVYV